VKEKLTEFETIKKLLTFLDSQGHTDIKEWQKPNRDFVRKAKFKGLPIF